jgi:diadenosine tetraphosphate (Ap4A) HIT family hydrolase
VCNGGNPKYEHFEVARTDRAVAFMNRYPTLEGYVLVAPLYLREQVTADMSAAEYLELQEFVYLVAEAVRRVMQTERVYILSLGSQAVNAHVHWHIVPLPSGVPLEEQQYHVLMHENGALEIEDSDLADLARWIGSETASG